MRILTGSVFLLTAEQAFAHSLQIGFPNAQLAQDILFPISSALGILGVLFLAWGLWSGEANRPTAN